MRVNMQILKILQTLEVKCYTCLEFFPYEEIDHDRTCGNCKFCNGSIKDGGGTRIKHISFSCGKAILTCFECKFEYERDLFLTHKCYN